MANKQRLQPDLHTRPIRRGLVITAAGLLPLAALVWLACRPSASQQSATAPSAEGAAAIPIVLSGPEEAARSALLCLKAVHEAHARHDKVAVANYLSQLNLTAAHDTILRRCQASNPASRQQPDEMVRNFIEGWVAIVGYYADGLQPDQLKTARPVTGASQVDVYATAASAHGDATIRFECLRGEDGQWRISRVDFAPRPMPASRPSP